MQVKLHGFKSYKDQAILEEFSPNVNVVGAPPIGMVREYSCVQACSNLKRAVSLLCFLQVCRARAAAFVNHNARKIARLTFVGPALWG
jgi:hypothetical protein